MPQVAPPISDISTGNWIAGGAGATFFDRIDETVANDNDLIETSGTASDTIRFGLGTVTNPVTNAGHKLHVRAREPIFGGPISVNLFQGTTLIQSWSGIGNGATYQNFVLDVDEANAANITDYSALEFSITSVASTEAVTDVSWVQWEVPDPTAPLIIDEPDNARKYSGETATFNITATGAGTLHYQWKRDDGGGFVNVGSDQNSYTTEALDAADDGDLVKCDVTDDNGTAVSATARLGVDAQPSCSRGVFHPLLVPLAWF